MEQKKIPTEERESGNIMTYYEMVRIIGTRAQQFNFGSPPLVEGLEGLHPAKMAYLELLAKMTPFIIKRKLPGKKYEEWRIDELDLIHEINDDFFVPEKFDFVAFVADAAKKSQNTEIYDRTISESGVADKTGKMERIKKTKKSSTIKSGTKKSNTKKSGSK